MEKHSERRKLSKRRRKCLSLEACHFAKWCRCGVKVTSTVKEAVGNKERRAVFLCFALSLNSYTRTSVLAAKLVPLPRSVEGKRQEIITTFSPLFTKKSENKTLCHEAFKQNFLMARHCSVKHYLRVVSHTFCIHSFYQRLACT